MHFFKKNIKNNKGARKLINTTFRNMEMRVMRKYYVVALLLVLGLWGCGDGDVAVVNGKSITNAQFDAYLKFKRIRVDNEQRREKLLDQYIEREALASVIEREGLLDGDLTQAELNEFRKEMFISRYFEKYLNEKVTDQAVQNYYNTHVDEYEGRKVNVAHILIRTNKAMEEPERKAKLTTAQEAYSRVHSGKDFAEVAKEYSEDKVSAKRGGNIGWIKEGSIDSRFSEIAFSLEPGKVSEPFETPFGFHVLKVLEGPKVVKQSFEAVAGDIRYQLRNKAKQAELERLMGKAKIDKG